MISIRMEIASDNQNDTALLKNAPHTLEMVTSDVWEFPYSRQKAAFPLEFVSKNKFWFDEFYEFAFTQQLKKIGNILWTVGDIRIIDRFGPNGIAYLCARLANKIKLLQSGYVYHLSLIHI